MPTHRILPSQRKGVARGVYMCFVVFYIHIISQKWRRVKQFTTFFIIYLNVHESIELTALQLMYDDCNYIGENVCSTLDIASIPSVVVV